MPPIRPCMRRRSLALAIAVATAAVGSTSSAVRAQVVNAPVAPDTIYVVRSGPLGGGVSVIDLNGFGCSTGDPTFDPTYQTFQEGWSNYVNNPNFRLQGALLGLLAPTSTLNGGSAGVFTLTKNSALEDLLLRAPDIASVGDLMIGRPLDLVFNDGPAPFGCQAGGGNLCASDGHQLLSVTTSGPNTLAPTPVAGMPLYVQIHAGNPISFAPHPNPPPLAAAPLCATPAIAGMEPSSADSPLANLLVPGDALGDPTNGVPPSGLLTSEQNTFFMGPSASSGSLGNCAPYTYRQQIGHFVYMIDRRAHQVVAVNSNTFEVVARIATPDPTELAMSPNVDMLAVSNRDADSVSFIDIDPQSPTFHTVVHVTSVEDRPSGIAWDPGNEDILVCNEGSDSVSILSAASFHVRKRITRALHAPFGVAITQRQQGFGFQRNVYFAYVLDRAGKVTLFESGPNGPNGWGFDQFIGQTSATFREPKAIQPDPLDLRSAVWIAHEGQLDANGAPTHLTGGAVTKLVLDSGVVGMIPLLSNELPHMRSLTFAIARSIGTEQLTGNPLDIAFDDQRNYGALPNVTSGFAGAAPAPTNGKSQVRSLQGSVRNTNEATYMFLAVRNPITGVSSGVDVIDLLTGLRIDTNAFRPGIQSIPARGAVFVVDYFRQ